MASQPSKSNVLHVKGGISSSASVLAISFAAFAAKPCKYSNAWYGVFWNSMNAPWQHHHAHAPTCHTICLLVLQCMLHQQLGELPDHPYTNRQSILPEGQLSYPLDRTPANLMALSPRQGLCLLPQAWSISRPSLLLINCSHSSFLLLLNSLMTAHLLSSSGSSHISCLHLLSLWVSPMLLLLLALLTSLLPHMILPTQQLVISKGLTQASQISLIIELTQV